MHVKYAFVIFEHTHYRPFLRSILTQRQARNSRYSMRAFAAQIGLTQAAVSQVLSGKRGLSVDTAIRIGKELGLSESENEYFRVLVQLEGTRNPDLKSSLMTRAQELNFRRPIKNLSVDLFRLIADWYHLPIKNLLRLKKFDFTPATISARLGVSKLEAECAIERLVRLKMIEPGSTKKGHYRVTDARIQIRSEVPNEALRRFHRQMLEKAIESLETQTPQEKILGSETFAISDRLLPEARKIAEDFFQKMAALSEQSEDRNQVYHLGVQFFNLMKSPKKLT